MKFKDLGVKTQTAPQITTTARLLEFELTRAEFHLLANCVREAMIYDAFLLKTDDLSFQHNRLLGKYHTEQSTITLTFEEALLIKNVLYEVYIELGEYEHNKRIGTGSEQTLALLRAFNTALKSVTTV